MVFGSFQSTGSRPFFAKNSLASEKWWFPKNPTKLTISAAQKRERERGHADLYELTEAMDAGS